MLHVCNKAFTIPQEGKFLFKPNTCLNCNSRAKTEMTERDWTWFQRAHNVKTEDTTYPSGSQM